MLLSDDTCLFSHRLLFPQCIQGESLVLVRYLGPLIINYDSALWDDQEISDASVAARTYMSL